jgi:Protein-L-isoaspartate(D-aspartate) O-methyltransferase (PCMT)
MPESRKKVTTRATRTKPFRHCRPIVLTSTIAIALSQLLPSQFLFAAAVFVFAQGPQLPPPSFINMPPSPTTAVLLGRRYASRDANQQMQRALVHKLKREGVIQHDEVLQVMQQVDRANYVAGGGAYSYPYDDSPQSISCGQTISAPHMHGYALEYILSALERPRAVDANSGGGGGAVPSSNSGEQEQEETITKVLDVGCGSGYLTAALGRWVHPHDGTSEPRILSKPGKVYGYVH